MGIGGRSIETKKERKSSMKRIMRVAGMAMMLGAGMVMAADAQPAAAEAKAVKKQTMCPIMAGNEINTNIYVDANGKRVYFCCDGCPAEFKKDPAKYITKMEKAGITLDKAPATTK